MTVIGFDDSEIYLKGEVSAANSTTTPLAGGGTFTGTSVEILKYGTIFVSVYADVASATHGLSIQQSTDGTNWDFKDEYNITAGGNENYAINPHCRYLRVVYTNGAGAQSAFRLQTILKGNSLDSSHSVSHAISDEDDARLVKSVLTAKRDGGAFDNIGATADGNLKVAVVEDGLAIAKGEVTGTTFVHKFGAAPDFDIGDGEVTVWDGADDGTLNQMVYQYSATADIDSISSTNAGDTQDIEIQGLDTNYDQVTQTVTLTGQTRVALGTSLIRVFRAKNVGSTDLAGDVYIYVNTAITAGKPDDSTKARAMIHAANNQTEMAIYTIPDGYTGYMRSWYASTAGAKKTSQHTIKLKSRADGEVFQLKHKANIAVTGTSYIHHQYVEPKVFAAKTDIEMTADTDSDIAGVAAGFDIVLVVV